VTIVPRRGWRLARILLVAVALDGIGSPYLIAQAGRPSEFEVKAVYLYNFGKFIEWPVVPEDEKFVICVLGVDPFGPILDRMLDEETLGGRPVLVERVDNVVNTEGCRIVFISSSEAKRLPRIFGGLKGKTILTVSDVANFASRGGMIELVLHEGRVRFDVDLNATRASGLELSSELLKVARNVRGAEPGEK
jgi:hypothetical protein